MINKQKKSKNKNKNLSFKLKIALKQAQEKVVPNAHVSIRKYALFWMIDREAEVVSIWNFPL